MKHGQPLARADQGEAAERFALTPHLVTAMVGGFYAFFLLRTYQNLSIIWGYLGFWYQPPSSSVTAFSVVACALLGMLLPMRNWTVVGFAKWVLYFVLFIPSLLIPPQQGALPTDDLILLEVLIWVSSATMILLLRDGRPLRPIRLTERTLWTGVIAAWIVGNLIVIAVFRDTMSLAGISEVYDQRASAATVGTGAVAYLMGMLSGAINPFLLVIGLARRRPVFIALGIAGQVVIYSTLAGKVVLGSVLLTIGAFFAFRHGRVVFTRIYAAVISFALLGPIVSTPRALSGSFVSTLSDLIYMRILVLPGVLVGVYSDFFLQYPITYLSHSLVGRPFSTYPYGTESIGQVIGRYVTPTIGIPNNYNANFIAADGVAGFSTWGVPIIFVLVGLWLWFTAKLVGDTERPIACAMLMSFVVSLADASLFTTLLTGGGALVAILLYLYRSVDHTLKQSVDETPKGPATSAARGV